MKVTSEGKVGIGTPKPDGNLHVYKASAGIVTANPSSTLVLESDSNNYMTILAPNSMNRAIYFGDDLNSTDGGIVYAGSNNMVFKTNGSNKMTLDLNGNLQIGTTATSAEAMLHIYKGSAGSVTANPFSTLVVESNTGNFISLLSPSTNDRGIAFGDETSEWNGSILYKGTTNSMHFQTNGNVTRMVLFDNGNLDVCGRVRAKEVLVETGWCDYVFGKNHKLKSLQELENYISKNQHLPGIPTASEVERNGLKIAEMSKKMMEKIEELTLYIIDINKRVEALESENEGLRKQIANPNH